MLICYSLFLLRLLTSNKEKKNLSALFFYKDFFKYNQGNSDTNYNFNTLKQKNEDFCISSIMGFNNELEEGKLLGRRSVPSYL